MMPAPRPRLILFARFPEEGTTKTRLIPALGARGAAALHRRLVLRTLRTIRALGRDIPVDIEIRFAGGDPAAMQHWLGTSFLCRPQCLGDLGQRMAGAIAEAFDEGAASVVIVGSDCPNFDVPTLATALRHLACDRQAVVFGPALDGGYYLVGLGRTRPELFAGIPWGTSTVLADSLGILEREGVQPCLLQTFGDLDRPADLASWQQLVAREERDLSQVSVVIPTLNEEANIGSTLERVRAGSPREILVADGGSRDRTVEIARSFGAHVVASRPGRAIQMNAAAAEASGNVLLFLHADSLLPERWRDTVSGTLGTPGVVAGAFGFRVSESFPGRRWVEWATNVRSRRLQVPYGDQGLFLRRALFEELGGFAPMPILEDYELVLRLRRLGAIATAASFVATSGRRWRRIGVIRTTLINQAIIIGYHLRVHRARLATWYR